MDFNVLVIGYSSIFSRRVLPAFSVMDNIKKISVATRSRGEEARKNPLINGVVYKDYTEGLSSNDYQLVYISTRNSDHFDCALAALNAGKHVVLDKPSVMDLEKAEQLLDIAKKKGLLLSEAIVYPYHNQFEKLKEFIRNNNKTDKIISYFSFPPLEKSNYRYTEGEGGAIYDLGPYALSLDLFLFGVEKLRLESSCEYADKIPVSFSTLITREDRISVVGHYGFNSEYQNWIQLTSSSFSVRCDRFFTTPPDFENTLTVTEKGKVSKILCPAEDTFKNYFDHVLELITQNDLKDEYILFVEMAKRLQALSDKCSSVKN